MNKNTLLRVALNLLFLGCFQGESRKCDFDTKRLEKQKNFCNFEGMRNLILISKGLRQSGNYSKKQSFSTFEVESFIILKPVPTSIGTSLDP
jgi:hypothetical protein